MHGCRRMRQMRRDLLVRSGSRPAPLGGIIITLNSTPQCGAALTGSVPHCPAAHTTVTYAFPASPGERVPIAPAEFPADALTPAQLVATGHARKPAPWHEDAEEVRLHTDATHRILAHDRSMWGGAPLRARVWHQAYYPRSFVFCVGPPKQTSLAIKLKF